jgi:hypothetical protein
MHLWNWICSASEKLHCTSFLSSWLARIQFASRCSILTCGEHASADCAMDLRSLNYIMLRLTSWVVKHTHPAVMDVFRGNPVCLMSCAHASLINFSVLTFCSSTSQKICSFLAARETENTNTYLGEKSLRCQFVRLSGFSVSAGPVSQLLG